jgi:PhnB protein
MILSRFAAVSAGAQACRASGLAKAEPIGLSPFPCYLRSMSTTSEKSSVEPYLFFNGRCEEAIEFYKQALGASVGMLVRFKDSPDPGMRPPGADEKVMHASFSVGATRLMASDGRCQGTAKFEGFSLSLSVADEAEADRAFSALADGGQVLMPLGATFFSPRFGMLTDRFGVSWMIIVQPQR